MNAKRNGKEKSVLSRQDIAVRRKQLMNKKEATVGGAGRRAIAGVAILASSVLGLLSVATFDAKDRLGPGFKNAIGPVGHAIAEALRGAFGVVAYALPLLGFWGAASLFLGSREKKRWPQLLSLTLLIVATAVLCQLSITQTSAWAHAPGGVIGREVGGLLTALFSTVGTVVLVSAIAMVAFIIGTELLFLRLCAWAWAKALVLGEQAKVWAAAFMEKQQARLAEQREAKAKAAEEEAAFLAKLEEEEAELNELEAAAAEAEAAADLAQKEAQSAEAARAAELAEKERQRLEKERLQIEKEATRLAKDAIKSLRVNQKEQRAQSVAAILPSLGEELGTATSAAAAGGGASVVVPAGDPAWVASLAMPPPPPPLTQPPPSKVDEKARRVPTIIEPPQADAKAEPLRDVATAPERPSSPPPPKTDVALPPEPLALAQPSATTALATIPPAGPNALARMPVIIEPKAPPKPTKKPAEQFQMADGRTSFAVPPLDVLEMKKRERSTLDKDAFLHTAERLSSKLKDFGIEGEVVEIRPGPVVTMYEFKPAAGVKISKIASLADDLAMAMEAMRVRIVAPIPGKGVVGIEVPNKEREMVFLKEIAEQDAFQKSQSRLTMCLGKDIEGMPYILDLAKAPHLLMAGTTGSGKSVSVNAMIMSILLKSTPEEVRFIMVDPKMLELSVYEGIPHLLLPVVTDPRKAAVALQWAVEEMTRRYKLLSEAGVRNITGYNTLVEQEQAAKKSKAATEVVDAKPIVFKPKPTESPKVATGATEAAAAPTPPAADAAPPKKKRRLLIVDVAPEGGEASATPPDASAAEAAPAPAPMDSVGVAAPTELLEDPREGIAAEVVAEALEAAKEGEIRVDEPTEQEQQALEEAAASAQAQEDQAASAEAAAEAQDAKEERKKLPFIVVIIDELADLMMVASKEVETSIARLAQMARAAGIHLMVATQRPSTDVVTGIIKANFPTRISFMLRSKPDSMTILGTIGAEALLGMGDMLIMPPTSAHLQRVHGCYVSETEIKKVVDHLKAQGKPVFDESILQAREEDAEGGEGEEDELSDELWDQAIATVAEMRTVSISMLQRKMRIGYNRAARMIERMEREGMVGPADGAKPREVLIRGVGQMPGTAAM